MPNVGRQIPTGVHDGYSGACDSGIAADEVAVRRATADDVPAMVGIGHLLPEWFNDQGMRQVAADVDHQMGAGAEIDGEMVGFATWYSPEGIGEIGWIAVSPVVHRSGVGTRLVEFAEGLLRTSGVAELPVDTLGESVLYEPYERTRTFCRAGGFSDFKIVITDNPGMPERLTLSKAISQDESR